MKILLTGGSGLLGQELQKYIKCDAPSHEEMDITKVSEIKDYDLIIHAAGYTDVVRAEKQKVKCFKTNYYGTLNLVKAAPKTPFVFISTEYCYYPNINFYTLSKYSAEKAVECFSWNYLIIRTLFKPRPFPWDKAFSDQYTTGDYVDVIAPLIAVNIEQWNRMNRATIHLGTERKTMFDLAKKTRPDVKPISVDDIKEVRLPKDYV